MSRTKALIYICLTGFLTVSLASNASQISPRVEVIPAPTQSETVVVPSTPTNVSVVRVKQKVIISWTPVPEVIRYYRVEASTDGGTKWYAGPVTRVPTISLGLPTKNKTVLYRVSAVGFYGVSLTSSPVSISIQ